ncbi:hypothetical protein V5799_026527 [Amblyomma americanum]|uniref:Uncharacterized protein n=1 Tax=Amblyomma americanum TaxID=6943 RepID=A0AAQ4DIB5_AMBAM
MSSNVKFGASERSVCDWLWHKNDLTPVVNAGAAASETSRRNSILLNSDLAVMPVSGGSDDVEVHLSYQSDIAAEAYTWNSGCPLMKHGVRGISTQTDATREHKAAQTLPVTGATLAVSDFIGLDCSGKNEMGDCTVTG